MSADRPPFRPTPSLTIETRGTIMFQVYVERHSERVFDSSRIMIDEWLDRLLGEEAPACRSAGAASLRICVWTSTAAPCCVQRESA
jgi:hypothetical protein